jgi:mxaJ protein
MSSDYSKALTALAVALAAMVAIDWRLVPARAAGAASRTEEQVSERLDAAGELRVCADPNNLPFSNEREEGFENLIARMVAADLKRTLRYTWWPQRRGFVRNTLNTGGCDVIMGVPSDYALALPTRPYYRSTYVFVVDPRKGPPVTSLDDPRLAHWRIGVHVNVPPAQALAARDLTGNLRGYTLTGDYFRPDPPRALIDAVAHGEVDIAVAWGPLAGYFAPREPVPLELSPVAALAERPDLPMTFAISMGVRKADEALRALLDREIERRAPEIRRLLMRYGVPLVGDDGQVSMPAALRWARAE